MLAWGILRTYVQFRALFALGENQRQNDGMVFTPGPGMKSEQGAQNPPSCYYHPMENKV